MKLLIVFILAVQLYTLDGLAQHQVVVISADMFQSQQRILLAPLDNWIFKKGNNPGWTARDLDVSDWTPMKLSDVNTSLEDTNGRIEGWFRIKIKLDESLKDIPLYLSRNLWAATNVYLDGKLIHSFGDTGHPYKAFNPVLKYPVPMDMMPDKEYLLAIHVVDYESTFTQREIRLTPYNLEHFLNLTGPDYLTRVTRDHKLTHIYVTLCLSVSFLLFFLYWFLAYLNPDQFIFRLIAWLTTAVLIGTILIFGNTFFEISYSLEKVRFLLAITTQAIMVILGFFILEWVLTSRISRMSWAILIVLLITNILAHIFSISPPFGIMFMIMLLHFGRMIYKHRRGIRGSKLALVAATVVPVISTLAYITLHKYSLDIFNEYDKPILSLTILSGPLFLLAYISIRVKETLQAVRIEGEKLLKVTEEKREILANQNILLEQLVDERTRELKQSLETIKSTQAQLIHSEKMASLGELTAGIAHEIQNPLNFVNNFSEVNTELIDEMQQELKTGNTDEALAISESIKENEEKINHHGKRADAIVKGMLQHSRSGSGVKEPTDINALAEEYLRLAYHGLRAKDKSFNATMKTDFDDSIGMISVIPQEIGRVILNLITNAFYVVNEKKKLQPNGFEPTVSVTTKKADQHIIVTVKDNGNGIPKEAMDKIFQPFFTTKPTGEGTGLGLSLSYDIVKAHGGELTVETKEGEGSEFIISLPTTILS